MRMQTTNRWISATKNIMDNLPLIQVTGLYEDLESGIRANVLIECVQANVGVPARFNLDLWRFDWLEEAPLRNMALSAAKRSALVLISTNCVNLLPAPMETWVAAWSLEVEEHPSALIALLSGKKDSRSRHCPLHDRLQCAARQKGADFFCEYCSTPLVGSVIHQETNPICREFNLSAGGRQNRLVPLSQARSPRVELDD